jgi:hypothetical protein
MENPRTKYIGANVYVLNQARELLRKLDDHVYGAPAFGPRSAVGVHLRHAFDFYTLFFVGLAGGKIDYDRRARDKRVEQDRQLALDRCDELIAQLHALEAVDLDTPLLVKVDIGDDPGDDDCYAQSSLRRELQSLIGHTIHHYALITYLLKAQGIDPDPAFGVAPSTLDFWERQSQR